MSDRTVTYRIRADVGQAHAQLAQLGASTRKAANDITSMDKSAVRTRQGLATLGATAGRVGLVAAGGLAASAKAAVDWESAFAGVQKTVEATATTSMPVLEGQLRSLARTMPATHAEIAATAEAAGQLGIKADDVAGFTETMLQLGETTNLSADEAATSLARFSNIMGTSSADVGRLGAAVVGLGNNFATTEAEVVATATRLAAAGNQAGLAESEIFGIAAAMSAVGVEAEAGGTAMSKVFTSIGDAVRSGDGNLQTFAEVAGVTADEFQRLFDANPSEAIGSFVEGMGDIAREGGNTSAIFKDLGLTDQRLMRAILSVGSATGSWAEATGLANEEWTKGTALTDEFAKRAGTTASEMTVAWNNIKDAAIDVGAAALPVLSQMAQGASAAAGAFSSLPGPLKSATGGLLGITAVLGGGLWFTTKVISGITATREALEQVGVSSTKASRAMRGVGAAAGVLAGVTVAFVALDQLRKSLMETLPPAEELEARLIALVDAPLEFSTMGLGAEFDSLADSIGRVVDGRWDDGLLSAFDKVLPGTQEARSLSEARAEIEALDTALAGLVTAGHADVAADALERLTDEYGLTAGQVKSLTPLLTGYNGALQSQANDSKLAEGATEDHTSAIDEQNAAMQKNLDAMREKRDLAIESANAEIAYHAAIDGARESIKENGQTLDITTEKGRANRTALLQLAAAWNDQSTAAKSAKGAHRDAVGTFVAVAVQMGMNEKKARAYAKQLFEIPPKRETEIALEVGDALETLSQVDRWLDRLNGKKATTYVETIRTGARSVPGVQMATGGSVRGPGSATSDSIPAWLSNGEFVIQAAAVQRYGADFFHRLNAMRFANGGMVSRSAAPVVNVAGGGSIDYDRLASAVLRARPLYGDVHVSGDPAAFKRQLQHDQQAAGLGGY